MAEMLVLLAGIAYLLSGFAFFGKWKHYAFGGKFLYLLCFPFHLLLCSFLAEVAGGIKEYAGVWKLVLGWLVLILLLILGLGLAGN